MIVVGPVVLADLQKVSMLVHGVEPRDQVGWVVDAVFCRLVLPWLSEEIRMALGPSYIPF